MTPFTTLVALAALASTGDAVLVQFASDSCAPCRAMQPAVSRLVSDGYPVQRIDVDKHPETARQFNVRGVPTFVLLVGNREAGRIEGPASYDRLAAMFQAAQPVQTPPRQPQSPEVALASAEVPIPVSADALLARQRLFHGRCSLASGEFQTDDHVLRVNACNDDDWAEEGRRC